MRLFVVLDVKGCGRVLGVFEDRALALQITERYPAYFQLHPAALLREVPLVDAALDWFRSRAGARPSERTGGGPYRSAAIEHPPRTEQVHVVLDSMGHLRLVGVMADRRLAERLVRKSPAYYTIHDCQLNRINAEVLDWITDAEQRAFLAGLIARE